MSECLKWNATRKAGDQGMSLGKRWRKTYDVCVS